MEKLEPYMKQVSQDDVPAPCRRCKHRHMIRWLLNVRFCEYSSYTCINRQKPCDEFMGDYGTQLELF